MNRTEHLKQTLLQNIRDNLSYKNLEVVLLNYGSRDDLHEWALRELKEYIQQGVVAYYHTTDPDCFHMSHAKNMAFRLATGDILCSVDADNYTGPGFAAYVNQVFNSRAHIFMAPPRIGPGRKWWDVQGRLCLWQKDFHALRGYDESIRDYGYEDQDLKSRLRLLLGRQKALIRDRAFLQAITHSDCMRITEGFSKKRKKALFLAQTDAHTSEVIYLQQDGLYERFQVKQEAGRCRVSRLRTGPYTTEGQEVQLLNAGGRAWLQLAAIAEDQLLSADGRHFYSITNDELSNKILLERAIYMGKQALLRNRQGDTTINPAGFGEGRVHRHFSPVNDHLPLLPTANRPLPTTSGMLQKITPSAPPHLPASFSPQE